MIQEYSKEFLQDLMSYPNRTVYAKIVQLNTQDEIIGVVTGGSINIDGASAVRRTCSLSLTTEDINLSIDELNWVFKTRFSLSIGLKNELKFKYPDYTEDIIWFPQGEYIITSFSNALSTNSYNISISGQDKMCLLNGEVSGILTSEVDFGSVDIEDEETGKLVTQEYGLEEIIRNIVHVYAGEPLNNIVISLPTDKAYDLIEYMGNKPLYLLMQEKKTENNESFNPPKYETANMTIQQSQCGWVNNTKRKISELSSYFIPENRLANQDIELGDKFVLGEKEYYIDKIEYKEVAGYEKTELTYAGELIGKAGETLTSILDKIKNMLGEYEYFFDIDGKFYFQEKPIQIQKISNNIWDEGVADEQVEEVSPAYVFEDLSLFTTFNNSPNIKNLKNDLTVWGSKKSVTGSNLPIHMRIVIDKKPTEYISPFQEEKDEEGNIKYKTYSVENYDWRELIYQMAKDYFKNNKIDPDYYDKLYRFNSNWVTPLTTINKKVIDAQTGYETYYSEMLAFWRDLYNPSPEDSYSSSYFNNQSSDLYINPWEFKTPENHEDVDKWYIEKEIDTEDNKCYIRWIDSLDLSPKEGEYTGEGDINPISLRQLYYYNSIQDRYESILQQDFGDLKGPVYIKYPPTSGDDLQVFDSYVVENILEQKGINPENLFWKQHSTSDFTPFIKRYNIKDLTESQFNLVDKNGLLLNSFYLKQDREGTLVKIYGITSVETADVKTEVNWDNISIVQNAQIIFYQEEENSEQKKKCEPQQEIILQAYDFKFQHGEEDEKNDYSLFINNNGRYLPLLEYLILDKHNIGNGYLEQVKYAIDGKVTFWSSNIDPSNNWKELGLEQNLEHIGDFWQQLNEQDEIEKEWAWIQSKRIKDIDEIIYNIPNNDVVTFIGWNSKRLYSKVEDTTNRVAIFYYYDNNVWNSFRGNFANFATKYTKISKDKKYHIESLQLAYHWGYYEAEDRWTWFRGNSYNNNFSYGWYEMKIPALIKQKSNIFISEPSNYNRNDLWILTEDLSINGQSYIAGTILITNQTSAEFNEAHWREKVFLDEFSVYTKKDEEFIPLISQISINRDGLKAWNGESNDFIAFYEILENIPTIYIKNKEVFKKIEREEGKDLPQTETFYLTDWQGNLKTNFEKFRTINYYTKDQNYGLPTGNNYKNCWHNDVFNAPQNLNFWLDFIDDDPGLEKYSIEETGRRPLVKSSESNVTAIAYFNDPNAKFGLGLQIPEQYKQYFIVSSRGLSAYERIKELLYNHTYVTESITINSIPLYNLEPNSKIRVNKKLKENEEDCYTDYYVDKISIPLAYNGTMSITATKAPPPQKQNNQEETT